MHLKTCRPFFCSSPTFSLKYKTSEDVKTFFFLHRCFQWNAGDLKTYRPFFFFLLLTDIFTEIKHIWRREYHFLLLMDHRRMRGAWCHAGLRTRLIFNRVGVQGIFASSSSKKFFSSSSSAKTVEFALLTVSLFLNATWKEFWFLLILVLTDLYNYFFKNQIYIILAVLRRSV